MVSARWIRWAGWALLPLVLVGLPTPGLSQVEKLVPGGTPRHQDSATALRVEVLDGELLLDGQVTPLDSLHSAIAARCANSPPVLYRVSLPASLECRRVEAILAAIGAGHKAEGKAAQYNYVPILLGLVGGHDLDAVAITMPTPGYRHMAFKVADARVIDITEPGVILVDGARCEPEDLSGRLPWLRFSSDGAVQRFPLEWVHIAAQATAPFSALYEVIRASRQAEVEHLSLWGDCALIDPDSLDRRYPRQREASKPPTKSSGGMQVDYFGFDEPPMPIFRMQPQYPDSALQAKLGGKVRIFLLINEFGEVFKAQSVQADGPQCLVDAALRAGRQWRFLPGVHRLAPIETSCLVPFEFEAPPVH
jgi:TonB family protein